MDVTEKRNLLWSTLGFSSPVWGESESWKCSLVPLRLKIKNPAYNRKRRAGRSFHPHHKSNELTWRALNEARAARSGTARVRRSFFLNEVTGKENGMTGLRLTDSTCYAQVLSDLHTPLDIPSQGPPLKDILGVSRGVIGP